MRVWCGFFDLFSLEARNEPAPSTTDTGIHTIRQDFNGALADGSAVHYIFLVYGDDQMAGYAIAGIYAADETECRNGRDRPPGEH